MEWLIQTLGAKTCCILSSGVGGLTNVLTKKNFNWTALKDILLAPQRSGCSMVQRLLVMLQLIQTD